MVRTPRPLPDARTRQRYPWAYRLAMLLGLVLGTVLLLLVLSYLFFGPETQEEETEPSSTVDADEAGALSAHQPAESRSQLARPIALGGPYGSGRWVGSSRGA